MFRLGAHTYGKAVSLRFALIGSLFVLFATVSAAFAQSASEVTPESFQPKLQKLSGSLVFTGQVGTRAPAGADQIGVTLSDVKLENAFPQMAEANAEFKERLTRGRIPVSELFHAVAELEATYAKAGFVLSRVVLPQQSLRDGGALRVAIVDGFVETIDVSQAPPAVRRRLEALTTPLVDRKRTTLADLERQLLLAGDIPGVALGSALSIGQKPGGTVITLDPKFRKATGFVGFDNFSSDALGGFTIHAGFELNGVLQFGESIYGRMSIAPEGAFASGSPYQVFGAGVVFPVGQSGLLANVEATTSDIRARNTEARTRSKFDRQSFRLIYPWVRSRKVNVSSQFALDMSQESQKQLETNQMIFKDKVTALRAGVNLSYIHDGGAATSMGLVLSRGLDALGARTAADVTADLPLSREKGDAVFTKLNASLSHERMIGKNLSLNTSARAQTSFGKPLLASEKFGIVGPSELSTFDSGKLSGDSGWVVRGELSRAHQVRLGSLPVRLSPYLFAGVGGIRIYQPTDVEKSHQVARSYGIGVDLMTQTGSKFQSNSLRIEFGKGEQRDDQDDTRFSISGNFRF